MSRWVPDAPHAGEITVRQLLAHTSGLPDYASTPEILGHMSEPHTPATLLAVIADEPLAFPPGTDHAYSNSNYVVLGLVLQAVAGSPWTEQVQARVDALGLDALSTTGLATVAGHVGGVDTTGGMDPSIPDAAGRMVGPAADVARWGALLAAGRVLPADLVDAMAEPTPESLDEAEGYGLGLMVADLASGAPTLGHSGSVLGFQSRLRVRRSDALAVATLVNDLAAEADDVDAALWEALGDPL
ncbi:MAG: serine hydrolase domain-containing protein [Myxococcota bacterium]